ncbi:hypothetical protein [Microcoleus sp. herbarium2]|uniref:hypothetical protein n=1 Tax=Microcoleus sp. herbarium2 TaxID=3055433 RepID=UPI002FD23601
MTFDPRTLATPVYEALSQLRSPYDEAWNQMQSPSEKKVYYDHMKEQKNQAVELYTYLSTWGMMRLRAEEMALDKSNKAKPGEPPPTLKKKAETSQEGKREVIQAYFKCLGTLAKSEATKNLGGKDGLEVLKRLSTDEYLGITGLGLALAQEFSFWATAVYHDISGEDEYVA